MDFTSSNMTGGKNNPFFGNYVQNIKHRLHQLAGFVIHYLDSLPLRFLQCRLLEPKVTKSLEGFNVIFGMNRRQPNDFCP